MAYTKTPWTNREVQNPRTFTQQNNPGGTITLLPAEGTIIEPGTPIIADNMNKIELGIEAAHNAVDALSVGSSAVRYAAASGTANVYAITLNPAPTAYTEGMGVAVKINIANTGAATINVNGLGAKAILKSNGNALASGNLKVNSVYTLRYNGTAFILQGEGGEYGTAGAAQVLAPYTIGTESGVVPGTLVQADWVHDWSAYQTVYDLTGTTQSVAANSWGTFVNITGKGFFKWCRASDITTNSPNPIIRLTIDGQVYTFNGALAGTIRQGNEINYEIPFKTSLKIEVFNSHTTLSANLICDYLYLLQQSNPNPNRVTLLQQSQRNMAYYSTATTTLADVVNITGSGYLLGARFLGYHTPTASPINGDITIDGVQKMTERRLFSSDLVDNKQSEIVGPIRFNSSLRVRTRAAGTGSIPVCFVWYSLD